MDTIIGNDIGKVAHLLKGENVVAIPTETVYGLAGNALSEKAILTIYEVKNRPAFNPLIVHVSDWSQVDLYAKDIPVKAKKLADAFSPGPITFLLNKKPIIPDLVTAGSNKVAIRIPAHPVALALLSAIDFPLAAPSANPFGYISPTQSLHVVDGLGGKIPYVLEGGTCSVGIESTIVGFDELERIVIHRHGGVSKEMIESVMDESVFMSESIGSQNAVVPGQLKSHYAPHTPLYFGDIHSQLKNWEHKHVALISFHKFYEGVSEELQFVLSPSGNIHEAACNLFSVLRKIDQLNVEAILADVFPDEGLGRAINDRLKRAEAQWK